MKKARQLAKKNIRKTQGHWKKQYNHRAQDNNIHAGDLVMLKVELIKVIKNFSRGMKSLQQMPLAM